MKRAPVGKLAPVCFCNDHWEASERQMKSTFLRQSLFAYLAAMVLMFGCNGIGCEGCSGAGDRGYPTHAVTPPDGGGTAVDGGVSVKGGFNNCPTVSVQAAPLMVRVGGKVMVVGHASDIDPGDKNLSYLWTASSGYFGENGEDQATFTCTDAGPVTITLAVSDRSCSTTTTISVFCIGIRDGGAAGGASGGTGAGGTGGMGGGGPMNSCPATEPTRGAPACATCTTDNCSLGPTGTEGCCGLAMAADQLLCQALYACFSANAASCTSFGDPTNCFCGTNLGTCWVAPGAANGPCVSETIAAAKTTNPMEIQNRFISPNFPLGRAVNLITCQGGVCQTECGLP